MHIVGVQLDIVWEDAAANVDAVSRLLRGARPPAGALVVLPEMFATGFTMNVARAADGEETERFLAALAAELGVCVIGGVVRQSAAGRGLNQALVMAPEGERARYTKIHPFSFGEESRHYDGGEKVATFEWGGTIVAPFVCYDLRFPEVFRAAVHAGAEVFAVIANWPAAREEHWLALLRARAIENQAYVIGVNRAGRDPRNEYSGRSQVIDPRGRVLADAGEREGLIDAALDLDALRAYRREFPALADARFGRGRDS